MYAVFALCLSFNVPNLVQVNQVLNRVYSAEAGTMLAMSR